MKSIILITLLLTDHGSLLFEAGATIKEVQFRLGRKDVKTTLQIYARN
ncbi:site-specific integrase [Lysinibacillus xylanilyticus]